LLIYKDYKLKEERSVTQCLEPGYPHKATGNSNQATGIEDNQPPFHHLDT